MSSIILTLSNKEDKINYTINAPTLLWARFYFWGHPLIVSVFPALNHVALFLSNK